MNYKEQRFVKILKQFVSLGVIYNMKSQFAHLLLKRVKVQKLENYSLETNFDQMIINEYFEKYFSVLILFLSLE